MPLTDMQFQLGTTDDPLRVLRQINEFLADHDKLAYSADEVGCELALDPETVLHALVELALLGSVDARRFDKGLHFRHARDLQPGELEALIAA